MDANDKDVDLQVAPSDEVESPAVNHNHGAKQSVEEVAQWDSQPKPSQPLQPVTTSESTTATSTTTQPNRHEIANKFGGAINRRMPSADSKKNYGGKVVNESSQQHEPSSKQPSPMDTTTATISSSSSIKPSTTSTPKSNHFPSYAAAIHSIRKDEEDIVEELFEPDTVTTTSNTNTPFSKLSHMDSDGTD